MRPLCRTFAFAMLAIVVLSAAAARADHKHGFVMVMNRTDSRHEVSLFQSEGRLIGEFKCNPNTDTTIKADCYASVLVEIDNGQRQPLGQIAQFEDGHWHIRIEADSHHHEPFR